VSVHVICKNVPNGDQHGFPAGGTVHKRDLSLLLMAYRLRHDPQPRVTAIPKLVIGHPDGACMMENHQPEKLVEAGRVVRAKPFGLSVVEQPGHARAFLCRTIFIGKPNQLIH
jgi:hypothetical protein